MSKPLFPWHAHTRRPRAGESQARDAMYRRELEERAALLYRLGYSAARTKARLRANVAWDFELHGRPRHAAEVDRIVDAIYRRGGSGAGAPSV